MGAIQMGSVPHHCLKAVSLKDFHVGTAEHTFQGQGRAKELLTAQGLLVVSLNDLLQMKSSMYMQLPILLKINITITHLSGG